MVRRVAALYLAVHAEDVGKYRAGAIGGISFALACFAVLAGGPSIATTVIHGRQGSPGGVGRALGSVALGWATAAGVLLGWTVFYLLFALVFLLTGLGTH